MALKNFKCCHRQRLTFFTTVGDGVKKFLSAVGSCDVCDVCDVSARACPDQIKMEWKLYAYGRILYKDMFIPPSLLLPPPLSPPSNVITRAAGLHAISAPPPLSPPHRIMDRFWQPRPKSRMASVLETVSMIAEFRQQQWSCTNFRCSDRTLRSRDRKWWKFAWPPEFWTPARILTGRAGTVRERRRP